MNAYLIEKGFPWMEADPCIIYIREVVIVVNCVKKTQYQLVALYVGDLIIAASTKNIITDLEGYSRVVSRHVYHCDKVARMTQHDARVEVHLLTAIALQNSLTRHTSLPGQQDSGIGSV